MAISKVQNYNDDEDLYHREHQVDHCVTCSAELLGVKLAKHKLENLEDRLDICHHEDVFTLVVLFQNEESSTE